MIYNVLSVSEDTKKKVIIDCKRIFLEHHPEMKNVKITENLLIAVIADYYIES